MESVFVAYPGRRRKPRGPVNDFLLAWLPVMFGIAVIIRESTESFSGANTSHLLRPLWQWIFGPVPDGPWEVIHHILRKTGHFLGYGLLGIAWLRGWLLTWQERYAPWAGRAWRMRSALIGLVCTAAVAAGDEIHQATLPDRTGAASDVLLDTFGAWTLMLALSIICGWWRRDPE